jgi:DnaB-like helicase C terminal domain
MLFKETLKEIDNGLKGDNEGLATIFSDDSSIYHTIPNIQKGTYYLIGAETKVGKTTLADDMFVFSTFDDFLKKREVDPNIDVRYLYFSFEIDKVSKIAKAICRKVYLETNKRLHLNYLFSKGKFKLSKEDYTLVQSTEQYFTELEKHLTIIDTPLNPTGIQKRIEFEMKKYGEEIKESRNGTERVVGFKPYKNLYFFVIIDHIALIRLESGMKLKENMDLLSSYLVESRNKYKISPIVIQQFSRDIASTDRAKTYSDIKPKVSDFKDSGTTSQDANIIIALSDPAPLKTNGESIHLGYDLRRAKNYRTLFVLRSRDGGDGFTHISLLEGTGKVLHLPDSKEFDIKPELYKQYF